MNPEYWQQEQQYDPSQEWPDPEPHESHWDPTQYENHYPGQPSPRHYQQLFDDDHHVYEEHHHEHELEEQRQHDGEYAPHESDEVQPEYEYMPHYPGEIPMMHSSWDPPEVVGGDAEGSESEDEAEDMGTDFYLGKPLWFWQVLGCLGFITTIVIIVVTCVLVRDKDLKKAIAKVVANNPSLHVENITYHMPMTGAPLNDLLLIMDISLENLAISNFEYIDATSSLYFMEQLVGVFNFELPLPNVQRFTKMVTYKLNRSPFEDYFTFTTVKGTFTVRKMSKKARGYFTASVDCFMFHNLTFSCG